MYCTCIIFLMSCYFIGLAVSTTSLPENAVRTFRWLYKYDIEYQHVVTYRRLGGLMASVLESGFSGPDSSPGWATFRPLEPTFIGHRSHRSTVIFKCT